MSNLFNVTRVLVIALIFLAAGAGAVVSAQTDTPRRTTAITYPLDELVTVQFRGTTRFPKMKGEARIRRTSRNGTEIDLAVSKMPRPFELGAGYATYVLWAISPEGQIDNLGEIKRRGFFEFDSKIRVTTRLQTFALLITAEPHFLVRRPSQAVMLENLTPFSATGKVIATTPAIQYFGNSSDFFRDPQTPEIAEVDYAKTPSAVLQAKQAVALARFAGADRDAIDELREAETLLQNAEESWKAGRDEEAVDIAARRSVSAAVKAETTALLRRDARAKRNEQTRVDAEMRQAENRVTDAQTQIADLKEQLASETRNRELAERDVATFQTQIRELRDENGRLREELGKLKVENETAKAQVAAVELEKKTVEEQRVREQRVAALQTAQPALIESLKKFGPTAVTERGIVVTIPETMWSAVRSAAPAPASDAKINGLAGILSENADYKITVESHTDARGAAEELQSLTDQRARLLADRFAVLGVSSDRIEAKGFGASVPIAANTSVAGRAKNRRIQIILTPINQ